MAYSPLINMTSDLGSGFDRARVEVQTTSFLEGREFHFLDEFSIAAGATKVIQVISPIDTVVFDISYSIDAGFIRATLVEGGTPGGTFNIPVNWHPANNMTVGVNRSDYSPPNGIPYQKQVTLFSGGTLTGGTEIEVVRLKVASVTNFASSFGSGPSLDHGMAPGTFYLKIQNLDTVTTTGTVKARWEERP